MWLDSVTGLPEQTGNDSDVLKGVVERFVKSCQMLPFLGFADDPQL